jgi:carboxypeptidase Q
MLQLAPWLFVVFTLLTPVCAAAEEPIDWAMVNQIRDEGFHRSQVMQAAQDLSEEIGPRLTGSPAMQQAYQWAEDKLKELGLANVHREPFYFGRGWSFRRTSVHLLKPYEIPLSALPKAWTPGTGGAIRGQVMAASIQGERDFEKFRGKLAGKILLIGDSRDLAKRAEPAPRRHTHETLDDLAAFDIPLYARGALNPWMIQRIRTRRAIDRFLAEEKVLATIEPSDLDWTLIRASRGGGINPSDNPGVPGLVMAVEAYNHLRRLADGDRDVELELEVDARFHDEDLNAYNVLGEIPGTDKGGEIVLVGAHLDSWHTSAGASDNAVGCAIVLEAVRILKALAVQPRRTIRVALWSAEEQGMLGSQAYVAQHLGSRPEPEDAGLKELPAYRYDNSVGPFNPKPEHKKHAAYFNVDYGSGKFRGIYTEGNAAVGPIFETWLRPFHDLGAHRVSPNDVGSTDHVPFDNAGIPAFQFIQDELDYQARTRHSNADVFDYIEKDDLKQASVILASFLYHAATRGEALPRKPFS